MTVSSKPVFSVEWDPAEGTAVFTSHEGWGALSISEKVKVMDQLGQEMAEVRKKLLTPSEREVVEHTLRGLRSQEIAGMLGKSVTTVDTLRSRAMAKVGARGMVHLAVAYANG